MVRMSDTEVAELFEGFGQHSLLMVVDGNNLLMRAIKAMEHTDLSADGVPTAAVHVFVQSLAGHVADLRPTHLLVCWDGGASTYRRRIYPDYKGQRSSSYDTERDAFDLAHSSSTSWASARCATTAGRPTTSSGSR